CAMPMFQAGRKPDHITGSNLLYGAALALRPTATTGDNECLTKRMCVPRCSGAWLERHACTGPARWSVCLKQRIDAHRPYEPIRRTFGGRLCANSFDFHI